jgi:hypothetical protein
MTGGRLGIVAGAVLPSAAHACAVCFTNGDANVARWYYLTAIGLSTLPLALLAALGGWLAWRAREAGAGGTGDERPTR